MIFCFLQSYQKPAVSEMSMISSYYQAYKCKVLIQIIHFEDHWKHAKLTYKFCTQDSKTTGLSQKKKKKKKEKKRKLS